VTAWKWDDTHQQAFDDICMIVTSYRDHYRAPIDYNPSAPPINLTTDGSLTGAGGVVSQGANPTMAQVISFWSRKFNSAQQNYPVHLQELLAVIESLK
jgi:RNase H-like domain found in reverse transcriptase